MTDLRNVPVWQMREAVATWAQHELNAPQPKLFGVFTLSAPRTPPSIWARLSDMIDEIERLRNIEGKD